MLEDIGKENGEPFPYLGWDYKDKEYFIYNRNKYSKCKKDSNAMMYEGITLHQIEMWLCEFQKYWKMIIGEGKQRSKFVPKTKTL